MARTIKKDDVKCDLCGDSSKLVLLAKCHMNAPLRATLEGSVLILNCYIPTCGREVARFDVKLGDR